MAAKKPAKEFGAILPRRTTGLPTHVPVPISVDVVGCRDFRPMVRKGPCCAPNSLECEGDVVPHHQPPTGRRGAPDHRMVVGLCVYHHRIWHDHAKLAPWDNQQTKALFAEIQLQQFRRWT